MEMCFYINFLDLKIFRVSIKSMFNLVLVIFNLECGIFYISWEMIKLLG